MRKEHPNAYMPWTEEDDVRLEQLYCEKLTVKQLSAVFGRNEGAITSRISKLELVEKYR
jgi:homoserine acetyltransferase